MPRPCRVRQVLEVEVADVKQRLQCHRARVRHLEVEIGRAQGRAELWRGAAPVSRDDRVQAMERELAFLEQARETPPRPDPERTAPGGSPGTLLQLVAPLQAARLRDRLDEQRRAIDRLRVLQEALQARVAEAPPRERDFAADVPVS